MGRVLLGWEMGGGLGHVSVMLELAKALKKLGHSSVLALRNLAETSALVREQGFPVVPAPVPTPQRRGPQGQFQPTAGYGDILAGMGFDDPRRLAAHVGAWDGLLQVVQPDLVIADHAPLLRVAAHGRVPSVVYGSGFTVPPCHLSRYPKILPHVPSIVDESVLLETFNSVQKQRGAKLFDRLPQILEADARFVITLPRLDPYAALRQEKTLGPLHGLPARTPPPEKPRLFVYMGADSTNLPAVLDGVARSGLTADLYIRDGTEALIAPHRQPQLTYHMQPPNLWDMLRGSSIVLHYGSLATSMACLATGRPQIIALHHHLEQRFNAQQMIQEGWAIGLKMGFKATSLEVLLQKISQDSSFAARTLAAATDIAPAEREPSLERVIQGCHQLIG
ncbi:hypothetical protein JCM17960_01860 [Magnetospira thiophila]